jgi:hypothetical protein
MWLLTLADYQSFDTSKLPLVWHQLANHIAILGETLMMKPENSPEDILRHLLEQSEQRWGAQRTAEIRAELEQAAQQLRAINQNLPKLETEPGFFQ